MITLALWAVFLLLFSWDLWEGLGNILGMPAYYEALGVGSHTPWVVLVAGMVVPILAPLGVFLSVRRLGVGRQAVALLVSYATVQALTLSLMAAEQAWRATVLQALPS